MLFNLQYRVNVGNWSYHLTVQPIHIIIIYLYIGKINDKV